MSPDHVRRARSVLLQELVDALMVYLKDELSVHLNEQDRTKVREGMEDLLRFYAR